MRRFLKNFAMSSPLSEAPKLEHRWKVKLHIFEVQGRRFGHFNWQMLSLKIWRGSIEQFCWKIETINFARFTWWKENSCHKK